MFINKIKTFFNSIVEKPQNITYKSTATLTKNNDLLPIPLITIPKNDKKNFLILDDNYEAGDVTYLDIKQLDIISKKMRETGVQNLTEKQMKFVSSLPNNHFDTLSNFNIDDLNIILVSGEMAAFSVFEAVDNGLKVDYGIFDILIGGYNQYQGNNRILTGIDVVAKILETNKNLKYTFYSGCSIDEYSAEAILFNSLVDADSKIQDHTIQKDRDLDKKKKTILTIIGDLYENIN